jgi:hypothetical protein
LEASLATGYAFEVVAFRSSSTRSEVEVANRGIGPIYYNAWVTVDGVRSVASLKRLQPGERQIFVVAAGGLEPTLTLTSDRLVEGQVIAFWAALDGES